MTGDLADMMESNGGALEVVERVVSAAELQFERFSTEDLAAEYQGRWGMYQLWFAVRQDVQVMHVSCALDLKIVGSEFDSIYPLLARINERLWLGHFDVWHSEGQPTWRHSIVFRAGPIPNDQQIADIVGTALDDCEKYFPAFKEVLNYGTDPEIAIASAIVDTVGVA
tara:strand:+ start:59294 stop:59797 length:504 start_codon:yes stop_codon:yes gene_type:complete